MLSITAGRDLSKQLNQSIYLAIEESDRVDETRLENTHTAAATPSDDVIVDGVVSEELSSVSELVAGYFSLLGWASG